MFLLKSQICKFSPIKGFTLIELLVSSAIMILLTAGGLAAYGNYQDRQQITAAGRHFAQILRTTQKNVTSGEKPTGCNGQLQNYTVNTTINTSTYSLQVNCFGDLPISTPGSLPHMATFSATNTITFLPLTGGLTYTTSPTVDIYNSSPPTYQYTITINESGAISDFGAVKL